MESVMSDECTAIVEQAGTMSVDEVEQAIQDSGREVADPHTLAAYLVSMGSESSAQY
jgi:hypothetical protein